MMKLFKSQELIHESMKHIDEVTRDNTTMKILDSEITINNIDNYINRFDSEYGVYDAVLERLFISADNNNYDNVFCRVGLLDLLYSTGIQRFNKGGIDIVTRHIMGLCQNIDAAKDAKDAKSIADGIKMINKSLVKLLEDKYGLKSYGKEGDEFNPDEHEAIGRQEDEKAKKETLAQVYLKGYKLKDKVIRHAKVMVKVPKN